MTAKEMFEELGYELVENSLGLKYQKLVADILWVIYFDTKFKYLTTALIHDEYEDEEPGDWYEGDESFSSMFGEDNYD